MNLKINGSGRLKQLINMLAWIEVLGSVGHSGSFKVIADGDGCTRWKFEFKDEDLQNTYTEIKEKLVRKNIDTCKDIDYFEI